jgi:hypothetical protein
MSNPLWRRRRSGRPRRRLTGCLLWLVAIIIVLIILSLFFGGFQKGSKVGGAGVPRPVPAGAARPTGATTTGGSGDALS